MSNSGIGPDRTVPELRGDRFDSELPQMSCRIAMPLNSEYGFSQALVILDQDFHILYLRRC